MLRPPQKNNKFFVLFVCTLFIIPNFALAKLEDLFEGMTSIENPFELRDPFKRPLKKRAKKGKKVLGKTKKGVYSNIQQIGEVKLEDLVIVGVLIGKERRAIVKVGTKPNPYIIKEGMKLGRNDAEIKAIVPGGIILVEKVTNIYGEDEYLETVIPISK
jgi:Tfp pilus assembly protein PilP